MMSDDSDNTAKDAQVESNTNLLVNYLPPNMTQEEVRVLFSSIGELESCKLVRDKTSIPGDAGHSLGYGFVKFCRPEDAEKAIDIINGLKIQNKTLKVSFARPSSKNILGANLYVSGFPKNMTLAELKSVFSPFGTIISSRILYDSYALHHSIPQSTCLSKGIAFIRFDTRLEAKKAIQGLNGTFLRGSSEALTVKFAKIHHGESIIYNNMHTRHTTLNLFHLNPPLTPYPTHNPSSIHYSSYKTHIPQLECQLAGPHYPENLNCFSLESQINLSVSKTGIKSTGWNIFVYNLPPECQEDTLWSLFYPFGLITNVNVVRDKNTNKSKRFGFVTMANYNEALAAIQSRNGWRLGNKVLQVSLKKMEQTQNLKRQLAVQSCI